MPSEGADFGRDWRAGARRIVGRATTHAAGRPALRRNARRALKSLGGAVAYAALVEPWWISVTHVDIEVPGLPSEMDGYRILHLTDIHHNLVSGRAFLQHVVARGNALDADMAVLTGDFVTHDARRMPEVFSILSDLSAPDGLWATRGNHDFSLPLANMRSIAGRAGIHLLENEHAVVSPSRLRGDHRLLRGQPAPSAGRLVVGGVSDLWKGRPDPTAAFHAAPESAAARVLLSHNPLVGELVSAEHRVAIQLSGHTHGGQVRPFQRPLRMLADGPLRYVSGLVRAPHTKVYISRGIGTGAMRLRWNCRPELALIVLRRTP